MKSLAIDYAERFIGKPYIWGGDDPIRGFDCSGLVQEILAAVGLDPAGDQNAEALYQYFKVHGKVCEVAEAGALAFFGKGPVATHVAFCIDGSRMVEAGGGGSKTLTEADAIKQNAYVRIRPVDRRKDIRGYLMPLYPA